MDKEELGAGRCAIEHSVKGQSVEKIPNSGDIFHKTAMASNLDIQGHLLGLNIKASTFIFLLRII